MKNKIKIILPILLVSSSVFVLFQFKKDLSLSQNSNQTSNSSNSINSNDQTVTSTAFQKLGILTNRCSGCGKCVHFDPAHFELVGGISKVISSTDLSSQNLSIAINNCPTQAITLQ